jgi:transposase
MNNKYFFRAKISDKKFRMVLRLFCLDIEAKKVAEFTGLNRGTVNNIFGKLRERIAEICESESPFENGEIELDESYFGARRVRGKRGRGAQGKTPVFGILKRGDKVYTQIVRRCSIRELMPIIQDRTDTDSIVYTDGFKTYDGLVNYGYKKHYRVHHGDNEFAVGNNHINGIENFWGLCKVRLAKFRGMSKKTFYLHIKECEFRYNWRNQNLYLFLLNILRKNKLN